MIKPNANKSSLFAIFAFMIILMVPMDFIMAGGSGGKSSENSENTESDQKWNYCKVVYCETCNDHRCQTKTCPSKVDECRSSGICLTTSFITIGLGISINFIVRWLQTSQRFDEHGLIKWYMISVHRNSKKGMLYENCAIEGVIIFISVFCSPKNISIIASIHTFRNCTIHLS